MTATVRCLNQRCRRKLRDPISRLRGRGPDCWREYREANGWPVGERRRSAVGRVARVEVGHQPVLDGMEEINDSNEENGEPT